jgi:pimeloyl-ACP methyl ester carboxylesterase
MENGFQHREAQLGEVRLHYVEAGTGKLVVLLHGFPEFWYSWREQIPAVAKAGYRVVAPDMRGYNLSSKPQGIDNYQLDLLAADVANLIRHLGESRAVVVGHDWGGAVAWHFAMHFPEMVDRLVVLNGPHPAAFRRDLFSTSQIFRSWYIFFFQLPHVPESVFRADDFAGLDQLFRRHPRRRGAFNDEDIRAYKQAFSQPGAVESAINYYRAAFRSLLTGRFRPTQPILAPVLLIWGELDKHLGVSLTRGLEKWVPRIRIVRLPEASHWVQHDEPERINKLLVEFIQTGA